MEAHHPSKILMTADTVGGVWNYSLELVQALAPFKTQVALATMGAPLTEEQRRQAGEIDNLTIYESNYKLEWMENPWEDVEKAGEWLLKLKDEVQPDLVHLNGLVHGSLDFWRANPGGRAFLRAVVVESREGGRSSPGVG